MKKEDMVCVNCNDFNPSTESCHKNPKPYRMAEDGLDPKTHRCSQGEWDWWNPDAYNNDTGCYDGAYRTFFWGDWEGRNKPPGRNNLLFKELSLD